MRDDERELLEGWTEGFAQVFGAAPTVAPLAPRHPEAPADLFAITFPEVLQPPEILGNSGHFGRSRRLVEHLRGLGFGWTDAGQVVTAPTPSTFNALLPLLGEPDAGYRVTYLVADAGTMGNGAWLLRYLDGELPVHVATRAFYAPRVRSQPGSLKWHFTTLAHDLTVHALNYHLIPRRLIADLGARVRDAMPARVAAWGQPGAPAPLTLTFFFDNDLNRYAYEAWFRTDRPSDFARVFAAERNYAQLLDALRVRIDETLAGKGDVKSGDTSDLPPLGKVDFRLA